LQFTTDICHISGQDIFADALSRIKAITAPVTHDALAAAPRTTMESSESYW
jgi:hypothetical protein